MIEIVSATRLSESDFWNKSPLGWSLRRLGRDSRLAARIAFANERGLPDVFNDRISARDNPDILVFIHDDVWIDDYFFADRVVEGCGTFDVIGVAGNRRRVQDQPAWAFIDATFRWDSKDNLSGSVAHGHHPCGKVSIFGPVPAECELLDGVFLAARKATLTGRNVLFDPRFDFHCYDLDFCRTSREKGLRLGTWPVCLTHQSPGAFGSQQWAENFFRYREKWRS